MIQMAQLPNQWLFTEHKVKTDDLFDPQTKEFIVTGVRDAFEWKDGKRTDNVVAKTVTLMCLRDDRDYGFTKSGNKIDNIKFESFDIKVENLNFEAQKGMRVKPDPAKVVKAVAYSNDYGEQVSILFSDLELVKK